ncbi:glycosyltransferase [Palleronia sp. LCG004]|uniref:glycosyltransferase n=1 Tax=Palleronia sp. LCG004 TaxID=3079304 RepID=UPI0029430821|nr:glycosyltransferase [Palleronia sp. LCG004]WOI56973.1 glycosyltransferase [Palleronia sp. LCG004]
MNVIAVIPARDESARLPAALAALRREGVTAIVVANGCRDATAAVAHKHGAFVIETPPLAGGVGEARAIGLEIALLRRPSWVMTTDADCTLAHGTATVLARALDDAEAAFGRVVPDAGEFANLPAAVRQHGLLEDRRDSLRALIDGIMAALPWNPTPCHGQSPGALIAWRPDAYRASGGIAPLPREEDRRMAVALSAARLRVARPWDAVVVASCRLRGRAPGGMATTIAARTRADLSAETAALDDECSALEHRLAMLLPPSAWPALPARYEGVCDVLAVRQTAI